MKWIYQNYQFQKMYNNIQNIRQEQDLKLQDLVEVNRQNKRMIHYISTWYQVLRERLVNQVERFN